MKKSNLKAKNNIEQQFLVAYDDHAEGILRHIYFRVSDNELAKDLASETFLKAWEYARKGNGINNYKSFLYRICNNLIIDHYRGKNKKTVSLDGIKEIVDGRESNLKKAEKNFDLKIIKKHFNSLTPNYKEILIYRFIDDLSIKEIRDITGKSMINIYTTIHRALKILKNKIKHLPEEKQKTETQNYATDKENMGNKANKERKRKKRK